MSICEIGSEFQYKEIEECARVRFEPSVNVKSLVFSGRTALETVL